MSPTDAAMDTRPERAKIWAARVITVLIAFTFGFSGIMKLVGGPELAEGMDHLGLPHSMVLPLAILELTCLLVFLVPATSVLGAILLTGYLGGAICTHWRVGDPFVAQPIIGLLVWLAVYLREPRLRRLIPLRTCDEAPRTKME